MFNMNCGVMPMANMSNIIGTMMSFSLRRRSGNVPQFPVSGPLNRDCMARANAMAVTRRPITAIAVKEAAIANEPLKIKNSPMNPFSPGRPRDENIATLIQPQSSGVCCINPPKSSMPRRPRRCSSKPMK